jgi:transposase
MTDISDDQLRQFVAEGLSQREISKRTGIPRATLYRRFQRLGLTSGPAPVQTPVQQLSGDEYPRETPCHL